MIVTNELLQRPRWATDTVEASQPHGQPRHTAVTGRATEDVIQKVYGRLLVKIYSRCNHIRDRPKRLEMALKRLRDENPDLPLSFELATWKDEGMGCTVLHWAVYYNRLKMIHVLVHAGCNVNARDCGRETPLFIACGKGDLLMVKCLVGLGADINVKSEQDETPLLVAAREGNPHVVKYLLANGALAQPAWPYYLHAGMSGNVRAVEALLSAVPVEAGFGPKDSRTVLQAICYEGHTEVVRALLSGGLRWATAEEGEAGVKLAILQGHLGVIQALQEAGALPDDDSPKGRMDLITEAVLCNQMSIMEALLSIRAPALKEVTYWVNEGSDSGGRPLLHIACRDASTKLVASMVDHYGWDRNARDFQEQSPLVYALRGHCFDAMTLAYLVKAARVSTEGLSEQHMSALMRRVSAAMEKPEWEEFLHWRHEYLVEKSQGKFAERRAAAAELEKVSTTQATQNSSLKDSPIPLCPISKVPMTEAMVAADGFVYQRRAIRKWVEDAISSLRPCYSPITGQVMSTILVPNRHVRAAAKQRIRW